LRVLITGAHGQVGHELVEAFGDHDLVALGHHDLDVTDRQAVLEATFAHRPAAIVHAAAWTAVDACETDPGRAFSTNAMGTRNVAEAARRVGAYLTYFSTDYVFDGTKAEPYVEWDRPAPMSVYGHSKLAGEVELRTNPDASVVRISWVCGKHGSNMVKTILALADRHEKLAFVDDQRGRPTFAPDAACIVRQLVVDRRPGIFHVTNEGEVTWYEFARAVLEAAGMDPNRVRPITTAELDPPRPAPRPANSVLDTVALRAAGFPPLPHFRDSLARLIAELGASE
jgi:dTDP-4-dehydrorhamnose reductase